MTLVCDAAQRSRSHDFAFEALVKALPKKQRVPLCASLVKQARRPADPPQTAPVAVLTSPRVQSLERVAGAHRRLCCGQVTLGVSILHEPSPAEGAAAGDAEQEVRGAEVRTPSSRSNFCHVLQMLRGHILPPVSLGCQACKSDPSRPLALPVQ